MPPCENVFFEFNASPTTSRPCRHSQCDNETMSRPIPLSLCSSYAYWCRGKTVLLLMLHVARNDNFRFHSHFDVGDEAISA